MIKRQKIAIGIFLGLFVLLTLLYLIVVRPLTKNTGKENDSLPEIREGEFLDGRTLLMFEPIDSTGMKSLTVTNRFGTYRLSFNNSLGSFVIEGMEGCPLEASAISTISVAAGYATAMERLDDPDENLSVYGLDEASFPTTYTITTEAGVSHTVQIGGMTPAGNAYYCRYVGRDAVYLVPTSVGSLNQSAYYWITPVLSTPVSANDYAVIDDVMIMKNGEMLVCIDTVITSNEGDYNYRLKYPEGSELDYYRYSKLLQSLSNLQGKAVVAAGSDFDGKDEDYLRDNFRIDIRKPYYLLSYTLGSLQSTVVFGSPDENGDLYAYSVGFSLVAQMNESDFELLSYDFDTMIQARVINAYLTDLSGIAVKGEIKNGNEQLSVDAGFSLESRYDQPGDQAKTVHVTVNGRDTESDADEAAEFSRLYSVMVSIYMSGYAEEDIDVSTLNEVCAVWLTNAANAKTEDIRFYGYSTTKCFCTVNGEGHFFVPRERVEKLVRDTDRFLSGVPIDYYAEN